jgi:hypothetical protein
MIELCVDSAILLKDMRVDPDSFRKRKNPLEAAAFLSTADIVQIDVGT